MKTSIFCKTQFEGIHCWPTIPETEEAQYLRTPHRHIFQIELYIQVMHSNRDIEFINLKHKLDEFLKTIFERRVNNLPDMGSTSCELLARIIFDHFQADKVIVSEDGENGAIVETDTFHV
jgi:hypothetical protein